MTTRHSSAGAAARERPGLEAHPERAQHYLFFRCDPDLCGRFMPTCQSLLVLYSLTHARIKPQVAMDKGLAWAAPYLPSHPPARTRPRQPNPAHLPGLALCSPAPPTCQDSPSAAPSHPPVRTCPAAGPRAPSSARARTHPAHCR